MSDLISKLSEIRSEYNCFDETEEPYYRALSEAIKYLSRMVKCKQCKYVYYDKEFDNYWCDRMADPFKVEADGYCKWGK